MYIRPWIVWKGNRLVDGGGQVAEGKVPHIAEAGADLTVISRK